MTSEILLLMRTSHVHTNNSSESTRKTLNTDQQNSSQKRFANLKQVQLRDQASEFRVRYAVLFGNDLIYIFA